jgi:hypothetical protein
MIDISHSPDGLVVASPGDLLPTLQPDRLLRESTQRHRVLSREITRLRIAEGAGMGFDRVYRSLAAAGKDPPQIQVGPRFTIVVPGGQGDRAFARFLRSPDFPEPRLAADLDVLLALSGLRTRSSVTATTLAPRIQRDEGFTEQVLTVGGCTRRAWLSRHDRRQAAVAPRIGSASRRQPFSAPRSNTAPEPSTSMTPSCSVISNVTGASLTETSAIIWSAMLLLLGIVYPSPHKGIYRDRHERSQARSVGGVRSHREG